MFWKQLHLLQTITFLYDVSIASQQRSDSPTNGKNIHFSDSRGECLCIIDVDLYPSQICSICVATPRLAVYSITSIRSLCPDSNEPFDAICPKRRHDNFCFGASS